MGAQRACVWTVFVLLWSSAQWIPFKLLQVVVGAGFTSLICGQIAAAWLLRLVLGDPPALRKVTTARQVQEGWQKGSASAAQHTEETSECSSNNSRAPFIHVFNEPDKGHASEAWRLVGPYMRQYGCHAIANSQLFNPEFIHFFIPGIGSLPYIMVEVYNRVVVVGVGEPLCHRSQWCQITSLFLQEFPEAYFYHITEEYGQVLHDMGYYINCAGTETTLQVQSWTYTAKTRTVRAAARAARDAGVRVRELLSADLIPAMRAKLQHEVSSDWLAQKAVADRELRVFVRNVDYDHMELRDGVRLFVAEAWSDPAAAPPASVDPVLQGAALNAKPPKPPRRSRSLASQSSAGSSSFSTIGSFSRSGSLSWLRTSSSNSLPAAADDAGPQLSDASAENLQSLLRLRRTRSRNGGNGASGGCDDAGGCNSDGGSADASISTSCGNSPQAAVAADRFDAAVQVLDVAGLDAARSAAADVCAAAACAGARSSSGKHTEKVFARNQSGVRFQLDDCDTAYGFSSTDQACCNTLVAAASAVAPAEDYKAAGEAAPAADAAAADAAPGLAAAAVAEPELVGFVLLDPLWEDGKEVGYVTSIMRMTGTAHKGTLKLLSEEVISKLRQEGCRELAFGFAPLCNMQDTGNWRYLHWMRWTALYIYHCANNVYAFKNLAFSKLRYGAGLDNAGSGFRDKNVSLSHIYMAAKHYTPGWTIVDLYGFMVHVGLVDHPWGMLLKLVGLRRGGANLTAAAKQVKAKAV